MELLVQVTALSENSRATAIRQARENLTYFISFPPSIGSHIDYIYSIAWRAKKGKMGCCTIPLFGLKRASKRSSKTFLKKVKKGVDK